MAAMLFKLPPHGMISRAFLAYSSTTVADTIMNIAATQKQIVIGDSHRLSANTFVRYMANLDPALQNLIRIREPFQLKGFTNRCHRCRSISSSALFIADDLETVAAYVLNEAGNPCGRTTQATDMGHRHPNLCSVARGGSYKTRLEAHFIGHNRLFYLCNRLSAISVVFFTSVTYPILLV